MTMSPVAPSRGPTSVTVYGVLAIPELTSCHTFTPDTSLKEASKTVFEPVNERYSKYAGQQPEYEEEHISASVSSLKNKSLRDLVADQHPLPISIVRVAKDPSLLHKMEATAAAGRAALAENLMYQIEQQPQVASKKGKKKKNAAAPVDSVPSSPDDLSQLVSRLISRVDSLEKENVRQLAQMKEENKQMKEENEQMKEENKQMKEANKQMKEATDQMKEENNQMKEENNQTRRAMWRIYRRMVLDQARIRLLDLTGINSEDFDSPALLEEAVKARLPQPFALKKSALDMIFKTGSVRQQGNMAAHEGPPEAIALSILGSDLSNSDRTTLAQVYKYVYGVEPALE